VQLARKLAGEGLINLEGEFAIATEALLKEQPSFVAAMNKGVESGLAANKVSA
jgi:hypothetical protein